MFPKLSGKTTKHPYMYVWCRYTVYNNINLQICAETIATNSGVLFGYPKHTMDSCLLDTNNFQQYDPSSNLLINKGSIHTDRPSSFTVNENK